ncbi:MAG: hypothetical protein RL758_262 [Pseudomonadota bacterium]|jgi:hypothetical protein
MDESQATDDQSIDQAAEEFAALLGEVEKKDAPAEPEKAAQPDKAEPEEKPAEENEQQEGDDAPVITLEIDGKQVQMTAKQVEEAYKSGLRDKDYRQKTMALADERKSASDAQAKAEAERFQLAAQLKQSIGQLEALTQIQSQSDWQSLLDSDPVEYLRQQHLFQQRQAALAQQRQHMTALQAQHAAQQQEQRARFVESQREEMLAKIPAWKDAAKAKAEMTQLAEYLKTEGYDERALEDITDHRPVVMARKAMLYDQIMNKAQAATKRVQTLPTKVERPGVGESTQLDKRSSAYQRLSKSGRVEDAAALFAQIL